MGEGDSKIEMMVFFSPNKQYVIIIALTKCVFQFELVSQVSNLAHGSIVYIFIKLSKCVFSENQMVLCCGHFAVKKDLKLFFYML